MPKRKKADSKTPTHAEGYELLLSSRSFSGYRGVYYNKGCRGKKKWVATCTGVAAAEKKDKGFVYLGCFSDKVPAAVAYAKFQLEQNGSPEPESQPNKRSKVFRREQEAAEDEGGDAVGGEGGQGDRDDTEASLEHLKPGSIRYHVVCALLAGASEREDIVEYVTAHSDTVGSNGREGPRKTIVSPPHPNAARPKSTCS